MRSRLEARFAAVLDRGEGSWRYEPRAYANGHGQYLPDFEVRFDDGGLFLLEVKPTPESAFAVMERMVIIWDSEPEAKLAVACPAEDGVWLMWIAQPRDKRWCVYHGVGE